MLYYSVLSTISALPNRGRIAGSSEGERALKVWNLRCGGGGRLGIGVVGEEEGEERIEEQRS